MKTYKGIFLSIFLFVFLFNVNAAVYNQNGDFSVTVNNLKQSVYNDDINTTFQIELQNNLNTKQQINIIIPQKKGWVIETDNQITLNSKENKIITINIKANSNFDYGTSVISPDIVKISQKDNYIGSFEFPVIVSSANENVSLKFNLDIEKRTKIDEIYSANFETISVSPQNPLRFVIYGENIENPQNVNIILEFAGNVFEYTDLFTNQNNYKNYQQQIPSSIKPGIYDTKITIRLLKDNQGLTWEWNTDKKITVDEYKNLIVNRDTINSFFIDKYTINVENTGNVLENFQENLPMGHIKTLLFRTDADYMKTADGIKFDLQLPPGDSTQINYSINYIPIYLLLLAILIIAIYFYIRKTSNPLDIETRIYEIKKVRYEGIKSMKIRLGFENIKQNKIDNLKLIFRMPTYLSIEENSFLLTKPTHVLKGKEQYKLIWEFKNFEKNDSRIIGFILVNSKGIIGDIKIPNLEVEVKIKGKTRKYYQSFPTIKR